MPHERDRPAGVALQQLDSRVRERRLELPRPRGRRPVRLLLEELGRTPGPRVRARQHDVEPGREPAKPARGAAKPRLALSGQGALRVVRPPRRVPLLRDRVPDEIDVHSRGAYKPDNRLFAGPKPR